MSGLGDRPERPEEPFWDFAGRKFREISDVVRNGFLETFDDAIGVRGQNGHWHSKSPQWEDVDVGRPVSAWTMLPYVEGLDQDLLFHHLEAAQVLLPRIERSLRARVLTDQFLVEWSQFCQHASVVEFAYLARKSLGNRRQGKAGGDKVRVASDVHDVWFARQFLALSTKGMKRDAVLWEVKVLLENAMVGKSVLPAGITREWIGHFFVSRSPPNEPRKLRDRYLSDLSGVTMKQLAASDLAGIPPLLKEPET
ncbi:hypothetical protein VF02_38135 [Nostoc linckia z1]|nr:hypothetical protein VF02_38135 [Nostoc linckia z1]